MTKVTLIFWVVTIIELADNKNALVAPVIEAVHSVPGAVSGRNRGQNGWMPLVICTADDYSRS
jgi:hypothetical protein